MATRSMDILRLISPEAEAAVDQVIVDSRRLTRIVNGTGTEQVATEDGSLVPSIRKALIDNFYFKTPVLPWKNGSPVKDYNQLYSYKDDDGLTSWWYAPAATASAQIVMGSSPQSNKNFKVFMDRTDLSNIYAPINSPLFTGNPRVPTPLPADDSSSIANTSWVRSTLTQAIKDALTNLSGDGNFDNITVKELAKLNKVSITGQFDIFSPVINAPDSELNLRKLTLKGANASFTFDDVPGKKVTNLQPRKVTTEAVEATDGVFTKVTTGTSGSNNEGLRGYGGSRFDSVVIEKNANQPAALDTLKVGGVTRVQDLIVEGTTKGITANVDDTDIKPKSVETTSVKADSVETKKLRVTEETNLSGKTAVGGELTFGAGAKVTGLPDAVKDQDFELGNIKGKSLTVTGEAKAKILTGETASVDKLTVNESVDLSRASIDPRTVTSRLFMSVPETVDNPAISYVPSGNANVYLVNLNKNITLNAPLGVVGSGKSLSAVFYFTQDATGNRTITLGNNVLKLGQGSLNPNPLGVTVVQMLYSGFGNIVDVILSARG